MKKATLLFLMATMAWLCTNAQNCNNKRFTEVTVFGRDSVGLDSGVYAIARNVSGQQQQLKYNVWYPKPGLDPLARRPFILMVHGGGFVGGDRRTQDTICQMFARRGFVAATIDYRLKYDVRCRDTLSKVFAVFRALQDAHAAMRFFTANAGNSTLRIDTSKLFVGGGSAGAATVLNLAYTTQDEVDQFNPRIKDSLGRIDTSGNRFRIGFRIKGIFNNWGALQKDFFDAADALPTISFHGDADTTVNIDSAADVQCLKVSPVTWGSRTLHYKTVAAGVCSNITVAIGGVHGIFDGTSAEKEFRVSKAACFFKSIFCGGCSTVYTTDTIPASCAPQAARQEVPVAAAAIELQRNPVTDVVTVNNLLPGSTTVLRVCDLAGRAVATNQGSRSISVQQLPAGTYLLQVYHAGTRQQLQFVKQ